VSASSVTHATFEVERRYPGPPALAFAAWSDPAIKARWFGRAGWDEETYELDFRVGGRERRQGRAPDGRLHVFDARFQDIVAAERIIFSYDMHVDQRRISVSLVTVTFVPRGTGTRLTLVEQGAFLDDLDDATQRQGGFEALLDRLATVLNVRDGRA
jgi:uncharacterized protein YndB with AHSA1/START domain